MEFNISKLNKLASDVLHSHSTLKEQYDFLFDDKSLNLKQAWERFKLEFNQTVMQKLLTLKSDIETKLLALQEKVSKIDELSLWI